MKKRKEVENGLGDYVTKNLSDDSLRIASQIITEVNRYVKMMDDSKLSRKEEKEIQKLCALNPKMMDLICSAFYSNGYDSF